MGTSRVLSVVITGDSVPLRKELRTSEDLVRDFGGKIAGFGRTVATGFAVAGAGVAAGIAGAVSAASDLEQAQGAVNSVFGDSAKIIDDNAKAMQGLGVSGADYKRQAALIGALMRGQGVSAGRAAEGTKNLATLGADLAAQFGGTTTDAMEAFGSALKGEFDPLDKFGISLKQSEVAAYAAANGLDLASAAVALIGEKAVGTGAVGAAAREMETWAAQSQVLKAKLTDLGAGIGTALMPYAVQLATWANDTLLPALQTLGGWIVDNLVPAFQDLAGWIGDNVVPILETLGGWVNDTIVPALQDFSEWVVTNWEDIKDFAAGLAAFLGVLAAYQGVVALVRGVTLLWAGAQAVLNFVMALSPIGLVVLAVAALAAVFVIAWQKSETFRNIVKKVFDVVKQLIKGWVDIVVGYFTFWYETIGKVKDTVTKAFDGVKDLIVNVFKGAIDKVNGLWDGMIGKINSVKDTIGSVVDFINPFQAAVVTPPQTFTPLAGRSRRDLTGAPLTSLNSGAAVNSINISIDGREVAYILRDLMERERRSNDIGVLMGTGQVA